MSIVSIGCTLHYEIDKDDVVSAIGAGWMEFAITNDGRELTHARVLHRPIFEFISGIFVVDLYQKLFSRVRCTGRTIHFPFRCDSPDRKRLLTMTLGLRLDGGIDLDTVTLLEEPRAPLHILDRRAQRSGEILQVCCICAKVWGKEERWLEIEDAVAEMVIFARNEEPQLSHGFCPACCEDQMRLLQS